MVETIDISGRSRKTGRAVLRVGVLDFFCGSGGVSAGLKAADGPAKFEIITGLDNDPHCAKTYERMIGAPCDQTDIFLLAQDDNLLSSKIAAWNLASFDRILLVGCSPCQGFSAHRKSIIGHDDRRDLFEAFCKIATRIAPDAILMENVPDMYSADYWPHFEAGRNTLRNAGFNVKSGIYNFASFGLPQERFRAVMIASKTNFELPNAPLEPYQYRTVRDAIGHLKPLTSGEADPSDPMHVASKHRESTLATIRMVPKDGGNRPVGVGPSCLDRTRKAHGGFTDVYGRLAWDRPSVTVTARCRTPSCGRFTHPEQDRGLTTREASLLQGFPANYIFVGPFDDGFKQVGNAVSPLVAAQLGEHIGRHLAGVPAKLGPEKGVPPMLVEKPIGKGFAVKISSIKRRRERKLAAA